MVLHEGYQFATLWALLDYVYPITQEILWWPSLVAFVLLVLLVLLNDLVFVLVVVLGSILGIMVVSPTLALTLPCFWFLFLSVFLYSTSDLVMTMAVLRS